MKRITHLVLGLALACLGSQTALAQEPDLGPLQFAVVSDIHFGEAKGDGYMVKVPRAMQFLSQQAPLDALAVAGDLTNFGTPEEYADLQMVFDNPQTFAQQPGKLLFMMGNHDNGNAQSHDNYQQSLSRYNGGEAYPFHQYVVIKGYPFITLSMMHHSYPGSYPQESVDFLAQSMARAAEECPGRPIFVFTHVPPMYGSYGTWREYEGISWGGTELSATLNQYPQAIVFAGHGHYPLADPRSIHQGLNPQSERLNYYTAVNTGSVAYMEIEGVLPPMHENVTEGLIVSEQANGDILIRRYDLTRGEEIGVSQRWLVKAPHDGSQFQYGLTYDADDNPQDRPYRNGGEAPVMKELSVEPAGFTAQLTIPQATDEECVAYYTVKLFDDATGNEISSQKVYSLFYLGSDQPEQLACELQGMLPQRSYRVSVTATDSYGLSSEPQQIAFDTTEDEDPANQVPEPWNSWNFDDTAAPLASEMGNVGLVPVLINGKQLTEADDFQAAGISCIPGPSLHNSAIHLPANAGLRADLFLEEASNNYTLMMDICIDAISSTCNALFQTNLENTDDADMCIWNNTVGIGALGYHDGITPNTWVRLVFVNHNGNLSLWMNGQLRATAAHWRWDIAKEGVLLFVDESGERLPIDVAQVSYWNEPLTLAQMYYLGHIESDPYLEVLQEQIRVIRPDDPIQIEANSNVDFQIEMPEWIEAIQATPQAGAQNYTFRALPMEQAGRRTGHITFVSEQTEPRSVEVIQIQLGDDIPAPAGEWLFDDAANLMAGTGVATLTPAILTLDGIQTLTPDEAGMVALDPADCPTRANGAVGVPVGTYLRLEHNSAKNPLPDYTLMFDIRPETLNGYNSLFINQDNLGLDGSLFIRNGALGKGAGGLTYQGAMPDNRWLRIALVIEKSKILIYVDGKLVNFSPKEAPAVWNLHDVAYLFADNDAEEVWTDVAAIRLWDIPLTARMIEQMGEVEQAEYVPDLVPEANGIWAFDDPAQPMAGTGTATLYPAAKGDDGAPHTAEDAATASIVPIAGPVAGNGAVTVPVDSYLQLFHGEPQADLRRFAVMMDIRPKELQGFQSLFNSAPLNNQDASLCLLGNTVGIGALGGYYGLLQPQAWHRVVFSVEECVLSLYIDGVKLAVANAPNPGKWTIHDGSLFFADNDGEEGQIDIAELRFWTEPLTASMVEQLGVVPTEATGIGHAKAGLVVPWSGTYDLQGRRQNSNSLPQGIYLKDGQKVVVR